MPLPKQRQGESDEAYALRLEAAREKKREWYREQRANNPEWCERERARDRERWANDSERRARSRRRERWANNPERRSRERERRREQNRKRIAIPDDHPGTCDVCGVTPPVKRDGRRGLCQDHRHDTGAIRGYLCNRCNTQVAVLDLAYTDPDRFAALRAYAIRSAPPVAMPARNANRRRKPADHPTLFDAANDSPVDEEDAA